MYSMGEEQIFMVEPGHSVAAHGLAMGVCDSLESPEPIKAISLVFIDCEMNLHPIILEPNGSVIQFLMSDAFRDYLARLIQEKC